MQPLNDIISSFTGRPAAQAQTQDPAAIAALVSGVTNVASAAGIKGVFSTMTEGITNKDIVVSAAKPLMMRAIETGDLDTLIDVSKSKASSEIKRFAPDVIASTCYNVQRPEGMSQQEFSSHYEEVKTAFNAIDPDWMNYKGSLGNNLLNGYCLCSNAFICDIIEAAINERKNPGITKATRQIANNKSQSGDKLTATEEPSYDGNEFVAEMERAVDFVNQENLEKMVAEGKTVIQIPPVVPPLEPQPEPEAAPIDLSNEKFMLLASLYVDCSFYSEMEKHFPHLHERFKLMGTYDRG